MPRFRSVRTTVIACHFLYCLAVPATRSFGQGASAQPSAAAAPDDIKSSVAQIESRVATLEASQRTMQQTLGGVVSAAQWMFGTALIAVSLFYGLTTYLQYRRELASSNENKDTRALLLEQ